MPEEVRAIFEKRVAEIDLDHLMPTRDVKATDRCFGKYKSILATIPKVGLIEPIAVYPCRGKPGYYVVLDGHLRLKALKELHHPTAACLIATEDDPFTYNDKVSRLSCIQEHRMIMKAIDQGITPAEIAQTLAVDVDRIRETMNVIKDIHPEAVEILKDKQITPAALRLFRKVKPLRQIECAELMVSMNNFTAAYARALLIATSAEMLVEPSEPKASKGLSADDVSRMEREMENLEREFKVYQDRYGENALSLNVAQRYVQKLVENGAIKKFLSRKFPEILEELTVVASMDAL